MKKILSISAIFLLTLILVACGGTDPAQAKLDTAHNGLNAVIADPSNVITNITVPTVLADGVTATWTSSEPGVAAIGTPDNGQVVITINRPAKGQPDAQVTLTAALSVQAEKSDKTLTKNWVKIITVKASTVEAITVDNIADILAIKDTTYDPSDKNDRLSVTINGATVFAKGGDTSFIYDGTGIIQVYGGAHSTLKVGSTYNISGLLDWYFGIWEITDSTAVEVANATPKTPTQKEITSVTSEIGALTAAGHNAYVTAADGNLEPVYAKVKGYVYQIPEDTSNYNTYIIDSELNPNNFVGGSATTPATGLLVYYNTNDFATLKTYVGFEVIIDVVIYTYRSNNNAFAIYYVGGANGIELGELTPDQAVELDSKAITVPRTVIESTPEDSPLSLPTEGQYGSVITWTSDEAAIIDPATGKVTAPDAQEVVTLTATTSFEGATASVVRTFEVKVGPIALKTIAQAKDTAQEIDGDTVKIEGVVTAVSANNTITIQDETGAIALYGKSLADSGLAIGDQVTIQGILATFNGLRQLTGYSIIGEKVAGTVPAGTSLDAVDFTAEALLPHQSKLVSATGLTISKVEKDAYDNIVMTFAKLNGQTISFKWDSRVGEKDVLLAALEAFKEGDVVDLVSIPLGWSSNAPLLGFDNVSQIVKSNADVTAVVTAANELAVTAQFIEAGVLELPATSGDVAITWAFKSTSSNNVYIDLETGAVTLPESGQIKVVLVATFTQSDVTVSKEYVVAIGELAGSTVTASYTAGSGTTNMTAGSTGNAALIGLNPDIFTVTSAKNKASNEVGLNNAGQIRLYAERPSGSGTSLTFAISSEYVITGVKIVFGASTNTPRARITLGDDVVDLVGADITNSTQTYSDLNVSEFIIQNAQVTEDSGSNGQVFILSIEITYSVK